MLFKCFSLLFEAFAFDEWDAHRKPSKNAMGEITQVSEKNNLVTFTQVFNQVFYYVLTRLEKTTFITMYPCPLPTMV